MAPDQLPMRKQRLREVDLPAQRHTASEQDRLGFRSQVSSNRGLESFLLVAERRSVRAGKGPGNG